MMNITRLSDLQKTLNDISVAVADTRNSAMCGDYDLAAEAAERFRVEAINIERVGLRTISLLNRAKSIQVSGASEFEVEIVAQKMGMAMNIPTQCARSWMTDKELISAGLDWRSADGSHS